MSNVQIIATYRAQDIGKARTLRNAIKSDGRKAFLTREGDRITLHAEPSKTELLSVGVPNHG